MQRVGLPDRADIDLTGFFRLGVEGADGGSVSFEIRIPSNQPQFWISPA